MASSDSSEQIARSPSGCSIPIQGPQIPEGAIVFLTGRYRSSPNNMKIEVIFQDVVTWVLQTSLGEVIDPEQESRDEHEKDYGRTQGEGVPLLRE